MKIKENVAEALREQLNKEFEASYIYLAMAGYFEENNLKGMAKWMLEQSKEEQGHGMKIFNFLLDRGAKVSLKALPEPKSEWANVKEVFMDALDHEEKVTESIYKLADLSSKEGDHATNIFLHWFVEEQVEEEASVKEIVEKLNMIGEQASALFLLDSQLAKR